MLFVHLPSDIIMHHVLPCLQPQEVKQLVDSKVKPDLLADMKRRHYQYVCPTSCSKRINAKLWRWFANHQLQLIEHVLVNGLANHLQLIEQVLVNKSDVIYENIVYEMWLCNGLLHSPSSCKPAFRVEEHVDNMIVITTFYARHGLLHRDDQDQPAHVQTRTDDIMYPDRGPIAGIQEWYQYGFRHRDPTNGPAFLHYSQFFYWPNYHRAWYFTEIITPCFLPHPFEKTDKKDFYCHVRTDLQWYFEYGKEIQNM